MVNGPHAGGRTPTRHGPETRPRAGDRTRHRRETGAAAAGLALWRFHLRAGVRLALRVVLPPVVAALGAAYLLGPDWVRVGLGAGGWLRQLPVGGAAQRRAAAAAVTVAQAPVAAVLAAFAVLAAARHAGAPARGGAGNLPLALSGLALACLAAALFVTPSRRPWLARPLALAGALASCAPDWALLAAGGVLVLAGDLGAGGLPRRARSRPATSAATGDDRSRGRPAPATPVDGSREAAPPALPATTAEKQDLGSRRGSPAGRSAGGCCRRSRPGFCRSSPPRPSCTTTR